MVYITTQKRCSIEYRPSVVIMPARWFTKIVLDQSEILGTIHSVIWGHWYNLIGAEFYPIQECICGKYNAVWFYSDDITQNILENGNVEISSPEGINVKITSSHLGILVEVWV